MSGLKGRAWTRVLAFAAVVTLWPVARLGRQRQAWFDPTAVRLVVAALAISVVVEALARRWRDRWWTLPVVAIVASAPLVAAGRWAVLWAASVSVAAAVGVHGLRVPGVRRRARPRPDLTTVLAALGAAAGAAGRMGDGRAALVPWALIIGIVVVSGRVPGAVSAVERPMDALFRAVGAAAGALGAAVGAVLMWIVATLVILVPWFGHRLLRWDPLASSASGGRWLRLDPWDPVQPAMRWSPEPRQVRTALRSWHGFVVGVVIVALVTFVPWGLWGTIRGLFVDGREVGRAPAGLVAMRELDDAPWQDEVGAATTSMLERARLSQYVGIEPADVTSEYLNVSGRRRATWRPAAAACPKLEVWMFGGSTTFGVGQRDDHTIASEVTRRAHDLGLGIEVVNWGVPSDVSWQQLRRLERALHGEGSVPDAVVFYDGYNDLYTTGSAAVLRWVRPGEFVGPLDHLHMRAIAAMSQDIARDGSSRRITVDLADPGARGAGRHGDGGDEAIAQYATTHDVAARLLASYGIPFLHVLQPMLDMRASKVSGEPATNAVDVARSKRFVRSRPPGVIDLSRAFDGWDRPVFVDGVHTVEAANRVVARPLVEHLAALLADVRAAKAVACG